MVDEEGKNVEVCHSRLRENAFASTRTAKMSPKNSSTTTDIFDKSHDVLKLHESQKQT